MRDGLRDTLFLQASVDLLPDPTDPLGEAERHGEHLAVPPRDEGVRICYRGHVDHAVLPDPLDLPGTAADDEVQALSGLNHHELLAEDADLLLGREVHDRVAALVPDRREVLEVVPAALRRHADVVPLLTEDAEVVEELRDPVGLGVLEFAVWVRCADRAQDLRPRSRASFVEGAADDLVGEHIQGEAMDVEGLEVSRLRGLDGREGLDRVIRGDRKDEPAGGAIKRVARAADSLNQRCDLPRRVVLDNFVDRPDVDAELEGACRDEPFDLPRLEARLDPLPLLSRQGAVMDSYILAHHRQPRPEQLSEGARVHEYQGRPALI